jgi:hypothetical protein
MADDAADPADPFLDAVSEEVERVLGEQRRRAENSDTKCGLALAFAGALIARDQGLAR